MLWLDENASTADSEYLIASHARSLLSRLDHDLEAADIDVQHQPLARGTAYLPVLTQTSNAILAQLRTVH